MPIERNFFPIKEPEQAGGLGEWGSVRGGSADIGVPASGCRNQGAVHAESCSGAVHAIASSAASLRPPSASLRFWHRAPEAPQDGVVVESLDVGIFKALAGTDGGREGAAVLFAVDRPD